MTTVENQTKVTKVNYLCLARACAYLTDDINNSEPRQALILDKSEQTSEFFYRNSQALYRSEPTRLKALLLEHEHQLAFLIQRQMASTGSQVYTAEIFTMDEEQNLISTISERLGLHNFEAIASLMDDVLRKHNSKLLKEGLEIVRFHLE